MPSERDAFLLSDLARKFVGSIEGCPDDEHFFGPCSAFEPGVRSLDSAAVRERNDRSRVHRESVSACGPNVTGYQGCRRRGIWRHARGRGTVGDHFRYPWAPPCRGDWRIARIGFHHSRRRRWDINRLRELAPTYVVRGNVDRGK